jgi:hypothetical protein
MAISEDKIIIEQIRGDVFRKNFATIYLGLGIGLSLGFAVGYSIAIVIDCLTGKKTYIITDETGKEVPMYTNFNDAYYETITFDRVGDNEEKTTKKNKIIITPYNLQPITDIAPPLKIAIYAACIGFGGIIGLNKINKFSKLVE